MAGRLKLAAQVLALALVAGLFGILVWKLARQDEGASEKLGRFPFAVSAIKVNWLTTSTAPPSSRMLR